MVKPNFSTVFCESLKTAAVNEESLQSLSDALHLSASERIGLGLALSDSENLDIRMCGKNFFRVQIAELCANPMVLDSTGLIQHILMSLNQSDGLSKHVDSYTQMLPLLQLKEGAQFILTPFLSDELQETNFFRHLDFLNEGSEDDFDAILAEMEKTISMADMMKELGYGCTVNVSQCKEMLSLFLPFSEVTIARVLATVVRTYADILVDSIKQLAPGISWINVMVNLDHEGFCIPNEAACSFFMSAYRYACKDAFPLHAVCGCVWKNVEGQISFLKYAVSAPPEIFSFAHSGRQLAFADAVIGDKFQSGHLNHAWFCYDLLEVLCQLAERGYASFVLSILENPLNYCPEILLLGLAHVNTAYNLLQYEVSFAIFPMVFKNASSNKVIHQLWQVNPNMLRGFIDAVNFDPDNMNRVLDACKELKILSTVLDMVPSHFGVRLAALASRKALIDLEQWLSTNLRTYKDSFYEECLKFLKEVQVGAQDVSTSHFHLPGGNMNDYLETFSIYFKVLQSHANVVSCSHLSGEMEKLHVHYVHVNLELKNGGGANSTTDVYADDIETESNSYFHQLFSGQLTIDTMIQMLGCFKASPGKREQSIFECMIASLFEEYKFFPKYPEKQLKSAAILFGSVIKHQLVTHLALGMALRAVLDALRKPADSKMFVFGTRALEQFVDRLIEWPQYCNHILQISHLRGTHPELVALVELVLSGISSVHAEPDIGHNHGPSQASTANMMMPGSSIGLGSSSKTGLQAPSPFQFPQRQIISLERKTSTTLSNYMKQASSTAGQPIPVPSSDIAGIQKPHSAVNASLAHSSTSGFAHLSKATSTKFGSTQNIETLVAAAERRKTLIEAPASENQDKISFIFNNLSPDNLEAKAKEFSEFLKEQYYPWFAQASIEYNFHELYLKFLDKVNLKPLNKEIVQASYENCKFLLVSELIKSSSEERSLLKNLGSWLGKITIGKNQVLRAREIDPKALIVEAYEKGLMIAVVPFTSKVLDSCSTSVAYRPPNPWTMGILGLFTEIYAMPNLKMNIKFEIELLFKNLRVDLKDETPTSLLKDRIREVVDNPDFSNNVGSSRPQMVNEAKSGITATPNQVDIRLDVASPYPTGHSHILSEKLPSAQGVLQGQSKFSVNKLSIPTTNIEKQVVVNPKICSQGLHLHLQSVLPVTMDRAIKNIVSSIVQRSVLIAAQTKELVLKDYAVDPDESLILNAAHLMVARLAGSLAHVTCKEPLRGSILSQLRTTLKCMSTSNELLEQAVQLLTNDNLDLGCALIEQVSMEKAIQTIDGEIAQHLSIRRKHREGVGSTLSDASLYAQGQMGALSEALHPLPGCLSHLQQRIYEDFVRLPWQNQSSQSSIAVPASPSTSSSSSGLYRQFALVYGEINSDMYSSGPLNSGLGVVPQTLDIGSEKIDTGAAQLTRNCPYTRVETPYFPFFLLENLLTCDAEEAKIDAKKAKIKEVIAEVPAVILRCINRDEAALAVAQKAFKGLYENGSNNAHVIKLVVEERTNTVIYADEDQKFKKDITVGLIRSELLNLAEYNVRMAKLLDAGRNKAATEFANSLIETLVIDDTKVISELHNLVDALAKLAARPGYPESLQRLVEIAKNPATNALSDLSVGKDENAISSRDKEGTGVSGVSREDFISAELVEPDPAAFKEQVYALFVEWYQICELPGANDSACVHYVLHLQQRGLLKGDDASYRFFHLLMEISVSHCLSSEVLNSGLSQTHQGQPLSFFAIDIYAKLVFSILKFSYKNEGSGKLSLLPKVLLMIVKFIQKDSDEKRASFNPRPYFRLFINWILDLCSLDPVSGGANFQVLTALANVFHAIQPLKFPGFSFAWLELISHRSFMPKLLTANAQKGWPYFQLLLVDLFQFMEPFLRNGELGESVQFLYRGTVRVLLVLLHDFPEFLCDYHFSFCDVIPPSCIQMRSIILSAFPRNMRLPDPSTPNLRIDLLAEIRQAPRILSEVDAALKAKQIEGDVDEYLKTRQHGSLFLSELKQKLLLSPSNAARAGTRYNVPLINSLVLYVGMQEMVQEQITRVLLERLIVNRPHQWGLLLTFVELIKNPGYNFWSRSFTRCASEIEKLFESVSRSCGGPKSENLLLRM
ncbi:Hypothetical predicted protein [Olea europaea subsp. europaea]|uniref:CCR4-NOT transcription complex subunit 1 n=1 Tax=Olea europaea subsp. europaea TaxID=158383 RepID=A0A8S0R1E8_OLEEU|nr:Hypothetical predicted protein [Olea europaea subsp. europaea]